MVFVLSVLVHVNLTRDFVTMIVIPYQCAIHLHYSLSPRGGSTRGIFEREIVETGEAVFCEGAVALKRSRKLVIHVMPAIWMLFSVAADLYQELFMN